MRILAISVDALPGRELSPNSRCHWSAKMKAKQVYKHAVWAEAYQVRPAEPFAKARLNLTFVFPDKRRRDRDNILSSFKPGQDALVLAGWIKDDNSECLTLGEVRIEVDKARAPRTQIKLVEVN